MARCKNAGMALRPASAIPPRFMKNRRENLAGRAPSQHSWLIATSKAFCSKVLQRGIFDSSVAAHTILKVWRYINTYRRWNSGAPSTNPVTTPKSTCFTGSSSFAFTTCGFSSCFSSVSFVLGAA